MPRMTSWRVPNAVPSLEEHHAQVWRIEFEETAEVLQTYFSSLTEEEQALANRRRAGRVRLEYVAGRGCLRRLLGGVLGLGPLEVPIEAGSHGKPALPESMPGRISFNVAHSGHTILIALCRAGEVGVDVERINFTTDPMEVARHSFSANEVRNLERLTDLEERRRAFFRCWTRKEAVVKADGRGLGIPLSSFEVPMLEGLSAPVSLREGNSGARKLYYVRDLPLGDELMGAIALGSCNTPIELLSLPFGWPNLKIA